MNRLPAIDRTDFHRCWFMTSSVEFTIAHRRRPRQCGLSPQGRSNQQPTAKLWERRRAPLPLVLESCPGTIPRPTKRPPPPHFPALEPGAVACCAPKALVHSGSSYLTGAIRWAIDKPKETLAEITQAPNLTDSLLHIIATEVTVESVSIDPDLNVSPILHKSLQPERSFGFDHEVVKL